ncbi:peptidoglycan O-acetyltransferase [Tissierella creatinophila DSM 6911]|uniref:Peptidoglycan O-acetyltransferase n=2 Tax=Tissierella creatinophila TaxID=79681 RepID=A0A1U7M4T8_TISCR|nr:peptidoglycan O-acetyltransferase [Tissierella creatinophila DSM 6911]
MVFSSILFLFYFLPISLILYFLIPKRFRNLALFILSLVFYGWGEPRYIVLMIFSTVVDYSAGIVIDYYDKKIYEPGRKLGLLFSVFINLGLLSFFKYGDFFIQNLNSGLNLNLPLLNVALPIGISFYTFQAMSYTIDVYRKEVPVQKNIISFGTYVTLFPQLIAGPIVRYKTVAFEIDNRRESFEGISEGIKRFIIGLSKKVLLANNIRLLWESVKMMEISSIPTFTAILGIVAFSFQIYFDFSGYSDMAIGLGKIFGFNFLENFNYPYMSKSITEFWRRWHISLGTWFKEYVYIPMGGNRVNRIKTLRNILIVWMLTGIWHGASWNFLFWGLYFGVIIIFEKLFLLRILEKLPTILRRVYTLFLVVISWVIFSFEDMSLMVEYLKRLFGIGGNLFDDTTIYLFYTNIFLIIILSIASTDIFKNLYNNIKLKWDKVYILEDIALTTLLIMSIAYLVDMTYNPFLYFRF